MITKGISLTHTCVVTQDKTAQALKSGTLPVFGTPSLAALMEETASLSVSSLLESGFTTVGSHIDLYHVKPSGIGQTVSCTSVLDEVDGRRLVFTITASDETGEIGRAGHERYIVNIEKFMAKVSVKR